MGYCDYHILIGKYKSMVEKQYLLELFPNHTLTSANTF
jgi:hypothetical protein